MQSLKKNKTPLITLAVTITVLIVMIAVGFTIGILSGDPDGLERMLIDAGIEEPEPFFEALLGWISNEYVAAVLGIVLTLSLVSASYYILVRVKKSRASANG